MAYGAHCSAHGIQYISELSKKKKRNEKNHNGDKHT